MVIISGLVGPKPRRKSVGDGHQVNIPEPVKFCTLFTVRYSERIHGLSVQPRGNPKGVKVSLRADDSGKGTG